MFEMLVLCRWLPSPLEFMDDDFMTMYNVGIAVCARGGGTAERLGVRYGHNLHQAQPVAEYSVPIQWAGRGSTRTEDFERALDAALECEADGRAILVHCRSSFDRAPALLGAFMRALYAWIRGLSLAQTLCFPSASVSICRPTRVQCSSDDSYVNLRVGTQVSAGLETDALENIARGIRSISSSTSASGATSTPSTERVPIIRSSRWRSARRNSWRFCYGRISYPCVISIFPARSRLAARLEQRQAARLEQLLAARLY